MDVPLSSELKNGQSVEIITADDGTPQAAWLDLAKTGKAKSAIRRALREVDREKFIEFGRKLARGAFENVGRKASNKALSTAATNMKLDGRDELLARLGSAEITSRDVVHAVYPDLVSKRSEEVDMRRAIIGIPPGQSFECARCCQPLPGERIVGINFRGRGVVVHAIDCESLIEYEDQPDCWLDLQWQDGTHPCVYSTTLDLTMTQSDSAMGNVFTLIGKHGAAFVDTMVVDRKPDFWRILVEIEVRGSSQLHSLMVSLESEIDVLDVSRHKVPDRKRPD